MMRVLVTLSNILEYGLDTITGNSREDLLARAAEMRAEGYELFVTLPDVEGGDKEAPTERNAFAHYGSDLPEPEGPSHEQSSLNLIASPTPFSQCLYAYHHFDSGEYKWICVPHNSPSKHNIEAGSNEPCLVMDPYGHDWEL
jgi:hypothetical protein